MCPAPPVARPPAPYRVRSRSARARPLWHRAATVAVLSALLLGSCFAELGFAEECGVSIAMSHRQPRNKNDNLNHHNNKNTIINKENSNNSNSSNGNGSSSHGRIVNGKESRKGAWPWQVSLQVLHPRIGLIGHWCGGVLIQPSWILTAAHCIHKYHNQVHYLNDIFSLPMPALWTVLIGDWDRGIDEQSEQRIPVENIFVHESFNNYNNDIALLQLSRPVSNQSQPVVCLDPPQSPPRLCVATGWGRNTPAGPLSAILRQARVPILDNAICRDKYKPVVTIESGHLCAGKLDGSTGACVGDSGGPLQCSRKDGRWFLAGITSFGFGCAKPGYPDVYTRLSHYLPWIRRQILKHSQPD